LHELLQMLHYLGNVLITLQNANLHFVYSSHVPWSLQRKPHLPRLDLCPVFGAFVHACSQSNRVLDKLQHLPCLQWFRAKDSFKNHISIRFSPFQSGPKQQNSRHLRVKRLSLLCSLRRCSHQRQRRRGVLGHIVCQQQRKWFAGHAKSKKKEKRKRGATSSGSSGASLRVDSV